MTAGDPRHGAPAGGERDGIGFRHGEQMSPPPPEQASEVAITRFEHVYEVDPRLMERWVLQQAFPNWDTLRIMHSRHDHLDWMHRHFAERVVPGSEILAAIDADATAAADTETDTEVPREGTSP